MIQKTRQQYLVWLIMLERAVYFPNDLSLLDSQAMQEMPKKKVVEDLTYIPFVTILTVLQKFRHHT